LNKRGAEMIGGQVTVTGNSPLQHIVMRNDIYIFYHYPSDWKAEAKNALDTQWERVCHCFRCTVYVSQSNVFC
jgi:hypothetical protein